MKILASAILTITLLGLTVDAQEAVRKEVVHPYIAIKTETRRMNVMGPELQSLPRRVVTASGHDGKSSQYSGVELREILKMAGVAFGKELRGKALRSYLLVEAADGYSVVFALPELDPEFTGGAIILADLKDGKSLPTDTGPFQIIVANEKRPDRSVRHVQWLRILNAAPPTEAGN